MERPKIIYKTRAGYVSKPDDIESFINNAKKPLIVWGQGVLLGKAEDELKSFVEKSGIPAVCTILGLSALPTSHPLNMGMVGMHGNYAPNLQTNSCDVLIAIGVVIRGDTYHFEIVSNESANGIMQIQLDHSIPVINAVLTTNSKEEALKRLRILKKFDPRIFKI